MNEPVYANALASAINDLDELLPEYRKLTDKIIALKCIVKGAATILGTYDNVDDKYKFGPVHYDRSTQQSRSAKRR